MPILFKNNASAPLAASISSSATTITVTTAQGALFPALSGSDYFYATLTNSSNQLEIVKVTARSSDSMTVVRGQEGTTAQAYSAADKIEVRVTAAGLANMVQLDGAQTISGAKNFSTTPTFSGGALSVSGGGTGLSSLTTNGIVYASGTTTLAAGSTLVFDGTNFGVGATPGAGFKGLFVDTNAGTTVSVGIRNLSATGNSRLALGNDIGLARFIVGYQGSTAVLTPSTGFIGTEGPEPFYFQTSGAEKARLTSAGAWSFGATGTNTGTSGQVLSSQGSGTNPTWIAQSSIVAAPPIISSQTAQATTSGTSFDFTSIPSTVKRVTVMFAGVSTNGSSIMQVQVGAGSIATSGYTAAAGYTYTGNSIVAASTSAFLLTGSGIGAPNALSGSIVFTQLSSLVWVAQGVMINVVNDPSSNASAGTVTLSGALDRIRITTVNGTDTFDAGSVNILYE
jgi:hypothetical protein